MKKLKKEAIKWDVSPIYLSQNSLLKSDLAPKPKQYKIKD